MEVINERLSLIGRKVENLSKREAIFKVVTPNTPKSVGKGLLFKKGDKAKTLKAAKTILKITEKAHT